MRSQSPAAKPSRTNPLQGALRVFGALVIREMITRYGRSPGGYVWAVLDPAGMIAILALAFSQFIHTPPLGESFILFYATGYIPFYAYSEIASVVSSSIFVNRQLMHFPMVTPLDSVLARFFLSFLTVIAVSFLVFTTLLVVTDDPVRLSLGPLFLALGTAAFLGLGIGTLNAVVFTFFPLWQRVWSIINRPLFILSAVFFTFESLPRQARDVLWWNPIIHLVGEARRAFYPIYRGDYIMLAYPLGIAGFCLLVGGFLLLRNRSAIIEV
ncbi:sugar ABC transporter permease [Rhodovulum sp. BSW8]|uniref:ABC transporter permease n=1 Tax=Rhodovulum visakhapatnamense TaxID=364297 RepID=A0A4R8G1S0_9RHOB|nr:MULTISPECIES: ABC transporter permease [Rhodovulum]OLS43250.1 hypothetical protein BV509_02105 [Rhodovulum sulfidophilum]MBL3568304.1 ABC transporter permease [Rhodovulum visakhapatnamense]MBL3576558.1 ABC transporter permease [Rhodovulum visakhapatnamense]RBO53228.1 sugar ABC transporter permease [Rhodovulum sp. BSW8]TDX31977.1 capsular polysaccharide transport system permease protein [Rhodovulum visakhapatnamense]